jgi:hypothetical protein
MITPDILELAIVSGLFVFVACSFGWWLMAGAGLF